MDLPVLLSKRSAGPAFVASVVVPVVFGAITGFVLGVSEIAYLVLSVLGIAGGYVAGLEHDVAEEGIYRGLVGGLLFGTSILVTHGLLGEEPKAELPVPETLLIVITAVLGMLLGWLGARSRAKRRHPPLR